MKQHRKCQSDRVTRVAQHVAQQLCDQDRPASFEDAIKAERPRRVGEPYDHDKNPQQ